MHAPKQPAVRCWWVHSGLTAACACWDAPARGASQSPSGAGQRLQCIAAGVPGPEGAASGPRLARLPAAAATLYRMQANERKWGKNAHTKKTPPDAKIENSLKLKTVYKYGESSWNAKILFLFSSSSIPEKGIYTDYSPNLKIEVDRPPTLHLLRYKINSPSSSYLPYTSSNTAKGKEKHLRGLPYTSVVTRGGEPRRLARPLL